MCLSTMAEEMAITKIYMDTCCYNRPFDDQSHEIVRLETEAKLIIQDRVKRGQYLLVWSFMLHSENMENLSLDKILSIAAWEDIAQEYCYATNDLLDAAKKYMTKGLKHKDSIHLACAVKHGCNYLITTDRKFTNKNDSFQEIEILNPMAFLLKEDCYAK